ncbi:MAG: RNA-binding transcriptional accessory protein [Oscillospiraceae bacterium]|jgi:uncharacterized protein|nr:RNA-binding transcriptional accessory protein [Oscillospiraceae bacterium]
MLSEKISKEFNIPLKQVEATVNLIDDGNTIPFIARYRKEVTGGLTDIQLRDLDERLTYLRNLEARKEEVIRLIDEQGKLTPELQEKIEKAEVLQRVEDLYKPFKQKRATRATKAKEKGLEPLAVIFLEQENHSETIKEIAAPFINEKVETIGEAIQGACDIIAEIIADDPELTAKIRNFTASKGIILTSQANEIDEKQVYELYYDFNEPIFKIPNHRILAVNRGEKEKKLKVKVEIDTPPIISTIKNTYIKNQSIFTEILENTIDDSYKRLISPSIEREMRSMLTERAESDAIKVFALNTEKLLMTPPVKGARIISIDPGYRTGCKVAVLDDTGKLLDHTTIYPTKPKEDIVGTERVLLGYVKKHNVNVIVIGNGTASRETEEVVADFISKNNLDIKYTIVNEAGASVYSASELASKEYPDLDVTTRGAMSLGRRLQDPLSELVKISTKSIGVGQYQHDLTQTPLNTALTNVVENVVNRVGVDLNTASPSLLSYVSGINSTIAKNIVAFREENGIFTDRKQLKKVSKLGDKAFLQCAGFLRISEGKEILDSTCVHPESYKVAKELLKLTELTLVNGGNPEIETKIEEKFPKLADLATQLDVGLPTLQDIISEIKKPARDPREDAPPVIFSREVKSFEDLTVGMELTGTVRNVVDFGAFVDIGVKQDGLVHISKIAKKFIKHPSEMVSVGDNVKVWITNIDKERGKIGLSMIKN